VGGAVTPGPILPLVVPMVCVRRFVLFELGPCFMKRLDALFEVDTRVLGDRLAGLRNTGEFGHGFAILQFAAEVAVSANLDGGAAKTAQLSVATRTQYDVPPNMGAAPNWR